MTTYFIEFECKRWTTILKVAIKYSMFDLICDSINFCSLLEAGMGNDKIVISP